MFFLLLLGQEGRHHPVSWWLAAYYTDAELFDQLDQRLQFDKNV